MVKTDVTSPLLLLLEETVTVAVAAVVSVADVGGEKGYDGNDGNEDEKATAGAFDTAEVDVLDGVDCDDDGDGDVVEIVGVSISVSNGSFLNAVVVFELDDNVGEDDEEDSSNNS